MFPFLAGLLNVTERAMDLGGEIGEVTSGGNLRVNAQERGWTGEGDACAERRRNGGGRGKGREKLKKEL